MTMMVMMMTVKTAAFINLFASPPSQITWTLNDCPITGQEYQRGHLQYVLGGTGNKHTLEVPVTSMMQAGRIAIIAENPVGKAVSAAALKVVGEYPCGGGLWVRLKTPPDHCRRACFPVVLYSNET